MSAIGGDFNEADIGSNRIERANDLTAVGGWEEPVAGERHHTKTGARFFEGFDEVIVIIGGEIEIIHSAGDVEVAVGIEAIDKAHALVAQIRFNAKISIEAVGDFAAILQSAAKFLRERSLRHIGDMRGHARDRESFDRDCVMIHIAAAMPMGIGHDGLPPDFMESDVLRRVSRCGGDRDGGENSFGTAHRPLQDLHAAHRAADHAKQLINAEAIDELLLRADNVGNGDGRETESIGLAGLRIVRRRSGRAHTSADDIRADDEEAVGIEGEFRADHARPPAWLLGCRMRVGGVLIAGEPMTDEHGVIFGIIELAVGLVGEVKGGEFCATIEGQSLALIKMFDQACALRGFFIYFGSICSFVCDHGVIYPLSFFFVQPALRIAEDGLKTFYIFDFFVKAVCI